jgi:hypothetical protein
MKKGMKELDGILRKHKECYSPVYVKGKEYPGNNPYLMNKINNLLKAGKLSFDDIQIDGKIVERVPFEGLSDYLFSKPLEQIACDINDEFREIRNANWARKGETRPVSFEAK